MRRGKFVRLPNQGVYYDLTLSAGVYVKVNNHNRRDSTNQHNLTPVAAGDIVNNLKGSYVKSI